MIEVTLANAYSEYLIVEETRGNSKNTIEYYKNSLKPFISFVGENKTVSDISVADLRAYYQHLTQNNLSTVSVQSYIRAIRAFITWCYQEDYISQNLCDKFRLPKARQKEVDILTADEVKTLISSFDIKDLIQLRNLCIVCLMLDSGLRKCEVVNLTLNHIFLSENYIIVLGKGNKERYVPIGVNTKRYLVKYLARRPKNATTEYVFLTNKNTHITDNTIKQMFRKLKQDTLITRIRPHLLRHTFATRFLENGGTAYSLQQILGHTTLEMSKKYVHLTTLKNYSNYTNYSLLDNMQKSPKPLI